MVLHLQGKLPRERINWQFLPSDKWFKVQGMILRMSGTPCNVQVLHLITFHLGARGTSLNFNPLASRQCRIEAIGMRKSVITHQKSIIMININNKHASGYLILGYKRSNYLCFDNQSCLQRNVLILFIPPKMMVQVHHISSVQEVRWGSPHSNRTLIHRHTSTEIERERERYYSLQHP